MLQMIGSGSAPKLYADDVFSAYLYTGNGSTQTIINGVDLAGKGGLVWTKSRSNPTAGLIYCTAHGVGKYLVPSSTNGINSAFQNTLTAFNPNGFSLGADDNSNATGSGSVSWTFRNAPKFHAHAVVNKTAGSNAAISFPELETLGMVRVKRTDPEGGSWYVWHRSLTTGKLLIGETAAAETPLGHITVSGTTITLVNGVIADGTYLVEAFAHDSSADGIIQCGSFTTDSSGNATVNLGWEPQYVLWKSTTTAIDWRIWDVSRGFGRSGVAGLYQNLSASEDFSTGEIRHPTATGFQIASSNNSTGVYLAIRRPNKPPKSGTEVYNAIARTGTGAAATITGVGFAPDSSITKFRTDTTNWWNWYDRMRGKDKQLSSNSTSAEIDNTNLGAAFDVMDGVRFGGNDTANNGFGGAYINHFFRRATGVYDQICYNGTGANKTEPHTLLGVAPELWRAKRRDGAGSWVYGSSLLNANEKILMPSPAGRVTDATVWNSTYPTATQFSLGTHADVNAAGGTYIMEMWVTLAGVSKVGAYTGNGGSQAIDCGFGTGARFIKIIRMTAGVAQDIYIWDTVRGIVAANDPHLSLNTTAAEVATDDSVDPTGVGFIVNQVAATNINVTGASYLFLAIA